MIHRHALRIHVFNIQIPYYQYLFFSFTSINERTMRLTICCKHRKQNEFDDDLRLRTFPENVILFARV